MRVNHSTSFLEKCFSSSKQRHPAAAGVKAGSRQPGAAFTRNPWIWVLCPDEAKLLYSGTHLSHYYFTWSFNFHHFIYAFCYISEPNFILLSQTFANSFSFFFFYFIAYVILFDFKVWTVGQLWWKRHISFYFQKASIFYAVMVVAFLRTVELNLNKSIYCWLVYLCIENANYKIIMIRIM